MGPTKILGRIIFRRVIYEAINQDAVFLRYDFSLFNVNSRADENVRCSTFIVKFAVRKGILFTRVFLVFNQSPFLKGSTLFQPTWVNNTTLRHFKPTFSATPMPSIAYRRQLPMKPSLTPFFFRRKFPLRYPLGTRRGFDPLCRQSSWHQRGSTLPCSSRSRLPSMAPTPIYATQVAFVGLEATQVAFNGINADLRHSGRHRSHSGCLRRHQLGTRGDRRCQLTVAKPIPINANQIAFTGNPVGTRGDRRCLAHPDLRQLDLPSLALSALHRQGSRLNGSQRQESDADRLPIHAHQVAKELTPILPALCWVLYRRTPSVSLLSPSL